MPKLLVVDDNAINLTLFRHLLQKLEGAEVECIDDPMAALDWCAANDPDLILLDYMMPGVNGLQFIERLRLIPGRADVPVVMVTADTESDVRLLQPTPSTVSASSRNEWNRSPKSDRSLAPSIAGMGHVSREADVE